MFLKEFQSTCVHLIYKIPRIRFLEIRCLEIMGPYLNIPYKNRSEQLYIDGFKSIKSQSVNFLK